MLTVQRKADSGPGSATRVSIEKHFPLAECHLEHTTPIGLQLRSGFPSSKSDGPVSPGESPQINPEPEPFPNWRLSSQDALLPTPEQPFGPFSS